MLSRTFTVGQGLAGEPCTPDRHAGIGFFGRRRPARQRRSLGQPAADTALRRTGPLPSRHRTPPTPNQIKNLRHQRRSRSCRWRPSFNAAIIVAPGTGVRVACPDVDPIQVHQRTKLIAGLRLGRPAPLVSALHERQDGRHSLTSGSSSRDVGQGWRHRDQRDYAEPPTCAHHRGAGHRPRRPECDRTPGGLGQAAARSDTSESGDRRTR